MENQRPYVAPRIEDLGTLREITLMPAGDKDYTGVDGLRIAGVGLGPSGP